MDPNNCGISRGGPVGNGLLNWDQRARTASIAFVVVIVIVVVVGTRLDLAV